jgi:nucleoside-triphosphatase THEP1
LQLKEIYILTGEINSGKTSLLKEAVSKKENYLGILQVMVNKKRLLYNISTKSYYDLEVEEKNDSTFSIGRFHFAKSVFFKAHDEILSQVQHHHDLIIIDEVGPLELQNSGHYDLIRLLLKLNVTKKLLFVTRSSLLDLVTHKFKIKPIEIFRMPLSSDELISRLQKQEA